MLLVNTEFYPLRNLVAFGPHISLLCTYLKTSGITQTDKLLLHALSAFCSDILIQDLCLARPFACLAAKTVHSNNKDIAKRFDTYIFVNHTKLFTTDNISDCLQKICAPHMAVELNVASWHHIQWLKKLSQCLVSF